MFLDLLTLLFCHHTDLWNHEPLPVLIPAVRMSVQVRFSPLINPSVEKSDQNLLFTRYFILLTGQ